VETAFPAPAGAGLGLVAAPLQAAAAALQSAVGAFHTAAATYTPANPNPPLGPTPPQPCPFCGYHRQHGSGFCFVVNPPSDKWQPDDALLRRHPGAEAAWLKARRDKGYGDNPPPGYTLLAQRRSGHGGKVGASTSRGLSAAAISVEVDPAFYAVPLADEAGFHAASLAVGIYADIALGPATADTPTPGSECEAGWGKGLGEVAVAAVTRSRLPPGFPLLPTGEEDAPPPAAPAAPTGPAAPLTPAPLFAAPAAGGGELEPVPTAQQQQPSPPAPAEAGTPKPLARKPLFPKLHSALRRMRLLHTDLGSLLEGADAANAPGSGGASPRGQLGAASAFVAGTTAHARAFVANNAANIAPQDLLEGGKAQLLLASGALVPLQAVLLDSGSKVSVIDQAFCDTHGIAYSSAASLRMRTADARLGELVGVTEQVLLVLGDDTPQRTAVPLSAHVCACRRGPALHADPWQGGAQAPQCLD
jgi:hypothetical protein